MPRRLAVMRDGLDIGRLRGLEIGALSFPLVRRAEGNIIYVDYTDTETLRRKYADDPSIDVSEIVDVDAIWGDQTLLDCLGGHTVDYIMASHVGEHVPDLITWLAEARTVLNPGGELRLALPDKRFSNDVLRQETRLSDLLAAWLVKARRPQMRDILDFRLMTASGVQPNRLYDGRATLDQVTPDHPFDLAVQCGIWARDRPDIYNDVHCLVAQAGTFARLMAALAAAGLLPLACVRMVDTAPPLFEFYAFLTPCDDPAQAARSWQAVQAQLHDPLPGSAAALQEAARAGALAAAETARIAAETELTRLKRSLSWRLTEPLRRVRRKTR